MRMLLLLAPLLALGCTNERDAPDEASAAPIGPAVSCINLDQVVAMGYGLVITEFDVNDNGLPADIAQRDRGVADYARAYLDLMFSYPQLRDVMAWGMVDSFSWLQSFSPRADGQPKRPNPFDAGYRRKPLHQAIVDAFAAAPPRS